MCIRDFKHCVIKLESDAQLVLRLCTPVQKGRVGWKTPSHFLLQLQIVRCRCFTFFCKGCLIYSLHIHFVNTGSVLPPTSRVTFPTWLCNAWSRASTRRVFVVKMYIFFFFFFWKWQIVSLDKTLIPRLGSCRALWSCNLDFQHVGSHWSPVYGEKSWNVFLKNLFSTEGRKTWTSQMTWGWVNYQEIFILEVN